MKAVMSIKIDKSILDRIREFCENHGLKQGFFVEKALREQLVREELINDITELKELRYQEKTATPFAGYLKKRPK